MASSCRNKRIGLFGGSFDPLHNGHLHVIELMHQQLDLDLVILLPNYQSPWKGTSQVSFAHRMAMCELAVSSYSFCEVSAIESRLPLPSFTIQTVSALKKELQERFGEVTLYFAVGDDQANKLHDWKDIDSLAALITFAVVQREGAVHCAYPHVLLKAPIHPASSTEIRHGDFRELPAAVLRYLLKHDLYLQDIIQQNMSKKRYQHTKSVTRLAVHLAQKHGLNVDKVRLAADLHDIAKEFSAERTKHYMEQEPPEHQAMPKAILHQYVGARYVHEMLGINDPDILEAIRCHTTGGDNLYVRLLFVADKIEPLRGYDVSAELNLALQDLNKGYLLVKQKQEQYLKEINEYDSRTTN